jgi:MinD superfamily P-loop ATPase
MSAFESAKAQVTAVPRVVGERCASCRRCVARRVCKSKAIIQLDPGEPAFIDASRCYGCRLCVPACPYEAIVASNHDDGRVNLTDERAVEVVTVEPHGPAKRAGLREGDLVVAIHDQSVTSVDDLHRFLAEWPIHSPVTLTVIRGMDRLVVAVTPTDANQFPQK